MQRLHRFLHWHVWNKPLNLEHVDIESTEARERASYGVEDGCTREPGLVHIITRVEKLWMQRCVDVWVVADEAAAFGEDF